MNISEQLLIAHSKENAQKIASYIGDDTARFSVLMKLFFQNENIRTQRATQVVSHCVDLHPGLLKPYIGKMITYLATHPEVAVRRNTVRLLQFQEIPEAYQGSLAETCFQFLLSAKEPVAVKAFSMTILYKLTLTYPDLKNELQIVITDVIKNASAGIVNRGNKILKKLND